MCKKNKIDAIRAVCNSAAKKLAVLGLALSVSGGSVVGAQDDAQRHLQRIQSIGQPNEETLQERLRRLERERDEKEQQAKEKLRQAKETLQQSDEKRRKSNEMYQKIGEVKQYPFKEAIRGTLLSQEADRLSQEADRLIQETEHLTVESLELDRQIAVLRAQIEAEQQEEPVEEMIEIVPENDEMEEEPEDLRQRNQSSETTNSTALPGLMTNVMNLPEQVMQQRTNQQQSFCGVSLMPLDLSKFYGQK